MLGYTYLVTTSVDMRRTGPSPACVLWVHLPLCVTAGAGNPESLILLLWLVARNTYVYLWVRGSWQVFGIRAGLPVGNPCYWSMLSLELVKTILKLQASCENFLRNSFLLLTWCHSISEIILPDLLWKGFTSHLLTFKARIKTLGVFFLSTPCQVANLSESQS